MLFPARDDAESASALHRVERWHLVNRVLADRSSASVVGDNSKYIPVFLLIYSFILCDHSREHRQSGPHQHQRCVGCSSRLRVDPLHGGRGAVHEQSISWVSHSLLP